MVDAVIWSGTLDSILIGSEWKLAREKTNRDASHRERQNVGICPRDWRMWSFGMHRSASIVGEINAGKRRGIHQAMKHMEHVKSKMNHFMLAI